MSIPPELAGAIPLIDRFQVRDYYVVASLPMRSLFFLK
jgi:hypothetical protein